MTAPILTITSAKNAVTLTLTDEAVNMRLSDSILDEVHREIESDKDVSAPGWAGNLARFVTGSVEKMLRTSIEYSLSDIASVDYRDGAIVFTYRKQHMLTFEDVNIVDDSKRKQALACFSPEDAQAFVAKTRELLAR
jgi:selenophosphate synthetase-related protein